MDMIQPILGVLGGCVGCQAGTELAQRKVGGDLNLITLSITAFISLEGLIFQSRFLTVKNAIPISAYMKLVILSFLVNMANNYAMRFDIYFPLFIIFKSGTLLAHLILRSIIQKHTYSTPQVASVLTVTFGVILFTLASYEQSQRKTAWHHPPEFVQYLPIAPFWIGISLLTLAVFISAYLGISQERLYAKYGRHHKEAMFYVHALSIPAFALLSNDLSSAIHQANTSEPFQIDGLGLSIPSAWLYILGVCIAQWVCVHNVYRLTAVTTSLNVNMIISLRKFISLAISFLIFGNPFNLFHLFGFIIVVIGTIFYARVF